jgi:hypothetical protein
MLLHLVERDVLAQVADRSVDAHAREAAAPRGHEQLLVFALPVANERSEDQKTRALFVLADLIDDLLYGLSDDRDAVVRTMWDSDAREQQAQVVVDLGDGAHGRPRIARRSLLVDRHRRRESFDEVDVRLLHLSEELARVGRQGFNVAALSFGVDRVERERRLPRSREARDHDHLVAWDLDVDVLEVVLARALDVDVRDGHQLKSRGGFGAAPVDFSPGPGPIGAPTGADSAGGPLGPAR